MMIDLEVALIWVLCGCAVGVVIVDLLYKIFS